VWGRVAQENNAFSEHPAPVVLDRPPKLFQHFIQNIITVYTSQSTMNLGRASSFCVKKTNHSTYLKAGGSDDDNVHVSSVITPALCNENVSG
jgi:hypothetical protein